MAPGLSIGLAGCGLGGSKMYLADGRELACSRPKVAILAMSPSGTLNSIGSAGRTLVELNDPDPWRDVPDGEGSIVDESEGDELCVARDGGGDIGGGRLGTEMWDGVVDVLRGGAEVVSVLMEMEDLSDDVRERVEPWPELELWPDPGVRKRVKVEDELDLRDAPSLLLDHALPDDDELFVVREPLFMVKDPALRGGGALVFVFGDLGLTAISCWASRN